METKNLSNKLSSVACSLADNDFIRCDIVISSDQIVLTNWKHGMIPMVGLRTIFELCLQFDLLFFVDFDGQKVLIHG